MKVSFPFAWRRIAVVIFGFFILVALAGCPPLFVTFRPEMALDSSKSVATEQTGAGIQVTIDGLSFILPPIRFDRRYATLLLQFSERRQPITIRTADIYVAAESGRRINLSGVQFQTGPASYVTAYANGTGEHKLAESYLLDTQVEWLALIFDAEGEKLGGSATLHIERMEAGDQTERLVYRYRLDCENLGKDWPLLDRWISIRAFSRDCEQ